MTKADRSFPIVVDAARLTEVRIVAVHSMHSNRACVYTCNEQGSEMRARLRCAECQARFASGVEVPLRSVSFSQYLNVGDSIRIGFRAQDIDPAKVIDLGPEDYEVETRDWSKKP